MYLDIHEIGDEAVRIEGALELAVPAPGEDEPLAVRDVVLSGTARRGNRGIDFRGRLEAVVELTCARCLDGFETRVASDFVLTLVSESVEFGAVETALEREDLTVFTCPEGKPDFVEMATEQLYLALPLKPVCKPDCKGLCPTCGSNRNRIECGCRREDLDPRLSPLQALKDRMDRE